MGNNVCSDLLKPLFANIEAHSEDDSTGLLCKNCGCNQNGLAGLRIQTSDVPVDKTIGTPAG